jgi:hypothetical protein
VKSTCHTSEPAVSGRSRCGRNDARRLMSIDHQDPNGVSTLKIEYDWTINNLVEKRTATRHYYREQ